jgi:hypothetical protein
MKPAPEVGVYVAAPGRYACDEPTYVALSLPSEILERDGPCVRREDCAALSAAVADMPLAADESMARCRFSDGTIATGGVASIAFAVCDPMLGLCHAGCPCDSGRICAFASQVQATGVCIPRTSYEPDVSTGCRAMPDRISCPTGQACLIPVRDNVGMPDRERWGVCMPVARCTAIGDMLLRGIPYRCDTTLTR